MPLNNNLCCSPKKVGTKTHLKFGPFQVILVGGRGWRGGSAGGVFCFSILFSLSQPPRRNNCCAQSPSLWRLLNIEPKNLASSSSSDPPWDLHGVSSFFLFSPTFHSTPPPPTQAPTTCSLMNAFNQVYEVSLLSITLITLNCCIISSATLRCSS